MDLRPAEALILTEQVRLLGRQSLLGTKAIYFIVAGLSLLLVPWVGFASYAMWAAAMLLGTLARDHAVRKVLSQAHHFPGDDLRVGLPSVALSLLIYAPAVIFMPDMDYDTRSFFACVLFLWSASAAFVLGVHELTYRLYLGIAMVLQAAGWALTLPPWEAVAAAFCLLAAGVVLSLFSRRLSRLFIESVTLRNENQELVQKLTDAMAEAASAEKAKANFLAAASHDLLQPVHALLLLVGLLREGASEKMRHQATERIELTAGVIESMFRGMLDQARLEAGSVKPRKDSVSVHTVCASVEAAYAARCQEKGLTLSMACAEDLRVNADPSLLDRVLRNLVDNAVKFTPAGHVAVRCERHDDEVLITVEDTGVGVPPEEQERVFEAFFRGHANSEEGVGLGLAVAQQMMALMDGTVTLKSDQGRGTSVQLRLPVAGVPKAPPSRLPNPEAPLSYRRILVIEDDRHAREALQMWIENQGSRVVAAGSLAEALAACSNSGFAPDCVLSDYKLSPGPDGLATLSALRTRHGPIRTLLITGELPEGTDLPEHVELLLKPLSPTRLLRALQQHHAAS